MGEQRVNRAPVETEEDLRLVKEFVLLPVLLDVLERDIRTLESVKLKMDAIYVAALRRVQDQIAADTAQLRQKMRERGIKVYEQQRTASGIEARYACRGYHRSFSMFWDLVKVELQERLRTYLQRMNK
jgi:hypothetical protein